MHWKGSRGGKGEKTGGREVRKEGQRDGEAECVFRMSKVVRSPLDIKEFRATLCSS